MTATRFLHLSDIHFSCKNTTVGFDPDMDVRNEVVRDIRAQVAEIGPVNAILVSGDIGYSGKKNEYDDAASWLDQVCVAAGCSTSSVYVCPGNHDVDRSVLLANGTIQDIHDAVRGKPSWHEQEAHLLRRLQEPAASRLLYEPLQEFNEFAARYECSFYSDNYAWDKDFPLNDGSILRLRAMNSAILSGPSDESGTLCLSSRAWTLQRHDGVEYMVMSHHPPGWLMDGSEAQVSFDAKSRIQLFGHEHDQRLLAGRDFVRLFAGSINPHRSEPAWRPGYNIIDVSIDTSKGIREMLVDVRQREWARQPFRFQDLKNLRGESIDQSRIRLDDWVPPATWEVPPSPNEETVVTSPQMESKSRPLRDVINQFFRLSTSQKNAITGQLALSEDSDRGLPDFERYKRALARARDDNKWEQLEEMLSKMERDHD